MSDKLVARLREGAQWLPRPTHDTCAALMTDAADCIEELEAGRDQYRKDWYAARREVLRLQHVEMERDILAEIVRLFDPWVTLRVAGHGPYLAHRRPAPGECITLTPDQAERFQQVLDRITKETSDDE